MADIATLGLEIQTGGVVRARRELDGLTAAGGRAEGMTSRLSAGFSGFARFAGPIGLVGAAVALGGRQALLSADAYTSLAGRLALVTGSGERLLRVQAALFEQAQRTRTDVAATTDLYGSLARSTQALGISQDRLLRVTESINQALIVSGTSGAGASAALVQLGQGFASGVLRGEELNSILEQTPRLAQAIADGLGVPLGQLRKLGQEGKLTAEAVFGALERAGAGLAAEFGRMPVTIAQARTKIDNSLGGIIATLDRLTGTTTTIASWGSSAADAMDRFRSRMELANREGRTGLLGFFQALGREQLRILGLDDTRSEVERLTDRLRELQSVLDTDRRLGLAIGKAGDLEAERRTIEARIALLNKTRGTSGRPANEGGGSFTSALFGPQPGQGDRDKPGRDRFAEEIAARRERIALIGRESELEKTAALIAVGAYGQRTEAEKRLLLAMAAAEDARRAENAALSTGVGERAKLSELSERLAREQQSETEALIAGNASLREEIETLGATEQAKAAIEQARVRSQRVMLEEAAAQLVLKGATEEDLVAMRQQIALLREREALIGKKADRKAEFDAQEGARRVSEDLARDARQDLTAALSAAFRDTSGNPIKAFSEALGNAVFTRVSARLADALVTQAVGVDGNGGLLSSLFSAAGSYFGSSTFVGPPEIAAGRAFGGPVRAGSLVPVNERGTEMLTMGGRDYLMAGSAGYVTPTGRGGQGGRSVSITNAPNITVQGGGDPTAVRREVAQALAENNRQLMRTLHEEGVL